MGMCCGSYFMVNIIQAGTTTIFNVCGMTGYSIQQGNGILSSTTLTRLPPIDVMFKQRAVGQGTDRTVSRCSALGEWRRGITLFFSCILAFFAVET